MLQRGTYARESDGGCLLYHSPVNWNDASYALSRWLNRESTSALSEWRRVDQPEADDVWAWCKLGPGESIEYDDREPAERWTVYENTPGYLPDDDDPPMFDTYAEAVAYLNDRCKEYEDDPDGNYTVDYGMAAEGNYAAAVIHDRDRIHDLGRWIAVTRILEEES